MTTGRAGVADVPADHVGEAHRLAADEGPGPARVPGPVDDRAEADRGGHGEAPAHVALPPPEDGGVHGEDQRLVLRVGRPVDHLLDQAAVPPGVDLEPEATVADPTDLLDRPAAHGREGVGQARPGRGPGRGELAVRMEEAGEADRGEHEGKGEGRSEHRRAHVDVLHLVQHAGAPSDGGERRLVGGQGPFVLGPAVEVVEDARGAAGAGRWPAGPPPRPPGPAVARGGRSRSGGSGRRSGGSCRGSRRPNSLASVPLQEQDARRGAAAGGDDRGPGVGDLALAGLVAELGRWPRRRSRSRGSGPRTAGRRGG